MRPLHDTFLRPAEFEQLQSEDDDIPGSMRLWVFTIGGSLCVGMFGIGVWIVAS